MYFPSSSSLIFQFSNICFSANCGTHLHHFVIFLIYPFTSRLFLGPDIILRLFFIKDFFPLWGEKFHTHVKKHKILCIIEMLGFWI